MNLAARGEETSIVIRSEAREGLAILHLAGSADAAALEPLRTAFKQSLNSSNRIICDLQEMDFICSDALGVLISAQHQAGAGGGYVRLVAPQHRIADILDTTQLNLLFGVYENLQSALEKK